MDADSQVAYARRWWTLGVLCLSLTVISIDNTILNVALPSIVRSLGAAGSELQLLIDGYTIVFACLLLTAGSLGDKLGRKGILTAGLALFGGFSAMAAFSGSSHQLILARALMGIGGACIYPSTLSILTNTFHDPKERGRAIGIWAGVSGLGVAIGPLAGGLLLEHFWWGAVFLVNVPICVTAIVLGRFFVPTTAKDEDHALDPLGAVLSIVGLVGFLYAIIEVPDRGWSDATVLTSFAVGVCFLAAFAWWELHVERPMLDLGFFANPRFSAASATITLTFFALYGSTFLLTQYFQFVLLYSPLKAGVLTAPVALGIMTTAPQAPKLVERIGTKYVVVLGLSIVSCGLLLYASNTVMSSIPGGIVVRLLFGIGMGFTIAPATESIMGSLPKAKAGVGSAVNDTTRQAGGALGVAVIGSVFAARYHSVIRIPGGLPAAARPLVHDSIGKALTAARAFHLDPATAGRVHSAASAAYLSGMRVAVFVGAAIVVCAAGVAFRFLPASAALAHEVERDADLAAAARELAVLDDGIYT
jgi:EmrB/QacA subfamily drug resistance transporter